MYAFQSESTLYTLTTQLNHLASLAKWLSVRLKVISLIISPWTQERLMYVQFTFCAQGVAL